MGEDRPSAKLREQLAFMKRSVRDYDAGHEEEALRLANAMRMLFHDTFSRKTGKPLSQSLLTQLSMEDCTILATPRTKKWADWQDFLAMQLDIRSSTPMRFLPRLDLPLVEVSRETWWQSESVTNRNGTSVSRRRLILNAADTDGGAHVDPKLERFYEELMAGEWGLGITGNMTYDGPPPFEQGVTQYASNGHLALIRVFAHEVLATAERFGWVQPQLQSGTTFGP
ncbi:hypothetical protein KXD97_28200 [Mycobacterium sp. SMC-8]|uniref:hypothetical protein n=1 Tax=Mycobacterium sp. SMC-8 TaxID=2857060 RepID=UPI0021B25217|nr:hypothetical protein [Mycobacterium sp. SMC-8]UXA11799.1 hypothetical protein KXD97_28200 [Mycobacterium sp. SMC-8]